MSETAVSRVVAAIADDAAAEAVLSTATAVSGIFGGCVEALHVGDAQVALAMAAEHARVLLRNVAGEALEALAREVAAEDVAALVVGARSSAIGKRPAGSIALRVISLQRCPVVVVAPDAPRPKRGIESVLVALDGTAGSAAAIGEIVGLAERAGLQIVVAHVHTPEALPAFSDHLSHEVRAWREEFIARYCPAATDATLELRVGAPNENVLEILCESHCDLVALAWSQDLTHGHAALVRQMLSQSPVPILLTPACKDDRSPLAAGAAGHGSWDRRGLRSLPSCLAADF